MTTGTYVQGTLECSVPGMKQAARNADEKIVGCLEVGSMNQGRTA